MGYTATTPFFRSLNDEEERDFRRYAREHKHELEEEMETKWELWHPVVRDELVKLNVMPEWYRKRRDRNEA